MQNSSNRKYLQFTIFVILTGAITIWSIGRFAASFSSSLRYAVFYLSDRPTSVIHRGDYVVFRMNNDTTRRLRINRVIKEAVCIAGDRLETRDRDFYCNGDYLGRAKSISMTGDKAPLFIFNDTISEGNIFVMGHTQDSFDSRYFGFVRTIDVEKIAYPLF